MNAEYMMHGFLHVPNASASRAAHVNLKRSQGVCLIHYFVTVYTVFCLHRLLCAARMNFEQLLLEFLSSNI